MQDQDQIETIRYLLELIEPKRELHYHAFNIPNNLLNGSSVIDIPFDDCKYVAVVNSTVATLNVAPGENYLQDPAAVVVGPGWCLSFPIVKNKKITVFWSAPSLISINSGANVACTIIFSNQPIALDSGMIPTNRANINGDGTQDVNIKNATVAVPQDIQSIYRVQSFLTTTLLGASATYTSASLDGIQFRRITGLANSAQAGTINLDQSDDGSTWYQTGTQAVTAATPAVYDWVINARYVRLRYVNGAGAQTTFTFSGYLCVQ